MKGELLRFLFPPRCAFCGRFLQRGEMEICARCMGELRFLPPGQVKTPGLIDQCIGALAYEEKVRTAIHRLKFRGRQSIAKPLGRLLAHQIQAQLDGTFDFITWVPTSAHNLRERGYDHAQLITEQAARCLDVPAVQMLKRVRHTRPMYGLNPAERRANVFDAFAVVKNAPVLGARVLVIDDILTTGATFYECARALREAGAEQVCAAAAAVAKKT